jgi:hypothetical protein
MSLKEKVQKFFNRGRHRAEKPEGQTEQTTLRGMEYMVAATRKANLQQVEEDMRKMEPEVARIVARIRKTHGL